MNLLDYAAVAVPAGFTAAGMPFGVTLFTQAHQDQPLLHLAARWQRALGGRSASLGATNHLRPVFDVADAEAAAVPSGQQRVAVCGAHLEGQPLNAQLTSRGARRIALTTTAPLYRLYALPGGTTRRPGLVRVAKGGVPIEIEIWEMPASRFGSFVAGIPAPLGIGRTVLDDGNSEAGFICEPAGLEGAVDISQYGGWRAYLHAIGR